MVMAHDGTIITPEYSDENSSWICPILHVCLACHLCVVSGADCWAYDGHLPGCRYDGKPGFTGQL